MNKLKYFFAFILLWTTVLSCSKESIQLQSGEDGAKEYTLNFEAIHINFNGTGTKAEEYQWPDGAKLYIHFSNKENTQTYPGIATYNSTTKKWTIPAPQGELHRGDSTACKVVYIEKESEGETITLTTDDVVYEDATAKYLLGSETLTIRAKLSPKTSRIRFKGTAGSTIKLYGTATYNRYNYSYNTFGINDKELTLTVAQDGYTPYIHAFFPNNTKRIEITDNNNDIFVFKCSSSHLAPGTSWGFTIPTRQENQGWTIYKPIRTFKIKDVEFNMIYVQWINGSFYIAETETTQKLWFAVTSENPSQFKDNNSDLPVESAYEIDYNYFEKMLQDKTGYPFMLPTFEQWLFAAKGGNKSEGYTYSGSNNLDEVAWHKDNSGDVTHPVKMKMPNELGLYDMNGNVSEIALKSDIYNRYQTPYAFGGNFSLSIANQNTYFDLNSNMSYFSSAFSSQLENGFRLCLNI